MCLSFNVSKRRQAVISQHRRDNMASLCISGVQPSPKWHIDNNIHKNKRHGIPNYWQATYIYFSSFQNDKSFKLHSASAAWRCPLSKSTDVPVCLGRLAKKIPPPPFLLWVTNLTWRFPFLSPFFFMAPFVLYSSFLWSGTGWNRMQVYKVYGQYIYWVTNEEGPLVAASLILFLMRFCFL